MVTVRLPHRTPFPSQSAARPRVTPSYFSPASVRKVVVDKARPGHPYYILGVGGAASCFVSNDTLPTDKEIG